MIQKYIQYCSVSIIIELVLNKSQATITNHIIHELHFTCAILETTLCKRGRLHGKLEHNAVMQCRCLCNNVLF